ncbi:hypothetical protein CcI156_07380 [Frankia sp. CcI156]|uniref:DUF6286 domain-containing protein n=1 Tax=Frankia TaxID=1854 RepID=UPI00068F4C08|nr:MULTISPECIES: DUF6286 domain-containing protein [Frankia]ONH27666.1 hypothetical protein CcI156_07380 [Frankia sp. CcI156]
MGRRIVAGLLAALIVAAGVITVIEIVAAAGGGRGYVVVDWPAWADDLADTAWSSGPVRLAAGVCVLVGLLLIWLGARRGTPSRLAVRRGCAQTIVFVERRGVARALRSAALTVDGVRAARVRVRDRTADVRLRLRQRVAGGARERAGAVLASTLVSFELAEPLELRIQATPPAADRTVNGADRAAGGAA